MKRQKTNRRALPRKSRAALIFEELEPRLLLSADLPIPVPIAGVPDPANDEPVSVHQEFTAPTTTVEQHAAQELVFIDTDTPDYQLLVNDIFGNSNHERRIEVILLDNSSDGIAQISDVLSEYRDLNAVHIISHGAEGSVDLGGSRLDLDTLLANTTTIQGWADAFSEKGDLLIYGCNLAGSADGQSLVNALGRLTGADVAASDDLTGNATLGGDWELEYTTGSIETRIAIGAELQQTWSQVLAVAVDNTSTGQEAAANTLSFQHDTAVGTDRFMLVGVSIANQVGGETVQSVKYNGVDLTFVGARGDGTGETSVEIWSMVAPDTGTNTLQVNLTGTSHNGFTVGVMTFTGVDQATPLGSFASNESSNGTSGSLTSSSANGELVFGVLAVNSSDEAITPGGGQTERWDLFANQANGSGSTEAGAASVTTSYSWGANSKWVIGAVSIKPSPNSAPTDISLSNSSVDELTNTTSGYSVGTLTATDPNGGDTHSYSIVGGADQAKFSIGGAGSDELILTDGVLDYETKSSYQVTVRVTDSGTPGLTYDELLTITVNDLNEAPTVNDQTFAVGENAANGTSLGSVAASDPDAGDVLTYSITGGNAGGAFYIDPATGEITVNDNSALDFESVAAFARQTGAANPLDGLDVGTRSKPAFGDLDGDGDLDAFISEYTGNVRYFENTGGGSDPVFAERTGPANPFDGQTLGYGGSPSLVDIDGDGDLDLFTGGNTTNIRFFENTGNATTAAFTEVTGPGNPLDSVSGLTRSVPSFADIDADGDYDAFIGEKNGTIYYYENTGNSTNPTFVQQTGAANPFNGVDVGDEAVVAFADMDQDGDLDAAVGALPGDFHYFENTGDASSPGFIEQTGDNNPFNGFIISDNAAPILADFDSDGDLDMFAGNAAGTLDYFKTTPSFNLLVQAEDTGGLTGTAIVTINLADLNEAPTDISLSNSSVDENTDTTGGYSVGTLSATDVDAGDTHTFSIVGGADAALFTIGGPGSDELILDDGVLNYEIKSSYQVTVRTTDSASYTYDETLTITVNDVAGNISGVAFADEGVTSIGAGKTISLLVNGVSVESVVTGAGGAYSFTNEVSAGDAVAIFIDNDATYQGITVTVADGTDLGDIQVYANHVVVRNDNGGSISIADMDNALGAYADPDIHYAVIGGNLVANAVGSELLVPAGHTFTPGGDVNATSIKILGTVNGGSNTFNIAENWDSATGSWFADTSTVNLTGTGTLNSAGDTFFNLTTGAASQITTLTSDLQVRNVLTIADSTGTLTDNGNGYDITVTGTGTPFVNNGATVTARNFIYRYPTDATITAAGGTYNVAENLWIAGSGSGSGTTYQLNGDLLVNGGLHVYATSFGVSILDTMGYSVTANSLQISNSAFQVGILSANNSTFDINGDVNFVNSVTTVVNLGSSNWSVYGDWTNQSNTFVAGSSTVNLDGVDQRISGSTSFYNLTKVDTIDDGIDSTLIFDNTATQTINGALTLTGLDADDRINLVSDVPGNQWSINLAAPAVYALNHIVVTDSDASGSDPGQLTINPTNSFSGGNNIGWFGASAGDDSYSVDEGSTTRLDLSANDSDPDDGLDLTSMVITSGPTNGSITVNADGTVDYTHDGSETVADSFTYTINDNLGSVSNTATVMINVNPVNDAPTNVALSNSAIDENIDTTGGYSVGTLTATDADSGDTHSYSIVGGADAGLFTIGGAGSDELILDDAVLDFETQSSYQVTVRVTDSGTPGLTYDELLTITVNDLNEAPSLNNTTFALDENAPNGASVGTVTGTDPDGGDSLIYSIVGGNIGNAFAIDPITGEITVNDASALNFEAIGNATNPAFASQTGVANPFNGINVGNRSTPTFVDIDGDGDPDAFVGELDGSVNFSENIGDANNPVFVEVSGPGNPLDGFDVGSRSTPTFADIDNDGDQDLFVGDRFGGIAYYQNIGNATSPAFVQVSGPGNPFDGVSVLNMSAPTLVDIDGDGDLDAFIGEWYGTVKYYENTGDAANPAFTEQTGAANPLDGVSPVPADFGEWTPKPAFSDLDGDGDYDAFIGLKNGTTEYWENTGDATTPVFSQQTGDANPLRSATAGSDEGAPAFVDIDGDGDLDAFFGNYSGTVEFFENKPVFNLTVQAQDGSRLTDTAVVRIDLNDVNEGPTDIDLSNSSIDENTDTTGGYSVGTLTASDVDDGDTHAYTIVGGADAALFTIGGAGGDELILNDAILDFEAKSSYQVTVRVTDSGTPGLNYDETFVVTVNGLNEAPTTPGITNIMVDEDAPNTVIDLFAAFADMEDPDASLVYTITNNSNPGLIVSTSIDGNAGTLTLDYSPDQNGTSDITVRATDPGGLWVESTFTVSVNPVNDAPINSVPAAQRTFHDTPLIFSSADGNSITVTDPDGSGSLMEITLSASNGFLTLAKTTGLSFDVGDGSNDSEMTFTGTAAAINTALNGLGFQPDAGYLGTAVVQIVTDDLGNVGTGGALNTVDRVSIAVTASVPPGFSPYTLTSLDELIEDVLDLPLDRKVNFDPDAEAATDAATLASGAVTATTSDPAADAIVGLGRGILSQGGVSLPGPVGLFDQNLRSHEADRSTSDKFIRSAVLQRLADSFTVARMLSSLQPDAAVWESIEAMMEQMDSDHESWYKDDQVLTTTVASGLTVSFTVGYVSWLLRAGYLSASLLSVLPLWREFDPLPIIVTTRKRPSRSGVRDQVARETNDIETERMFDSSPSSESRHSWNETV